MRTRMTTRRWEISVRVDFSSSPSSSSSFAAVEYSAFIKSRRRPRDRFSLSSLWSYRLKRRRRRRRTRRRGEQSVRDNATHLKEQTTTQQMRFLPPLLARRFYSTLSLLSLLSTLNALSLSLTPCICLRRVAIVRTTCVCVNTDRRDSHTREMMTESSLRETTRDLTRESWI